MIQINFQLNAAACFGVAIKLRLQSGLFCVMPEVVIGPAGRQAGIHVF
jgi:hypothetical protein